MRPVGQGLPQRISQPSEQWGGLPNGPPIWGLHKKAADPSRDQRLLIKRLRLLGFAQYQFYTAVFGPTRTSIIVSDGLTFPMANSLNLAGVDAIFINK
jgi:hypothetical protein